MGLEKQIILGGGCFWCVEAVIQRLKGVAAVIPGYSGGQVPGKPTYREICSGRTGHAEVIAVTYDSEIIDLRAILQVFFSTHNPTTLNRQGADVGTQYRSVIFYKDQAEKAEIAVIIKEMQAYFSEPIVTSMEPLAPFYEAEKEHHNYYDQHPTQGYCQVVIDPKIAVLKKGFKNLLKDAIE